MIFPTPSDILRCVDQTLLDSSDVELPRMAVKSALATCRHLIRHVELRIRLEQEILLDDIAKTAALLGQVAAYLDTADAAAGLAGDIRAAVAETPALLQGTADDMERIRARALSLREYVYAALKCLQGQVPEVRATESYREVRRLIREYTAYQIRQEAKMIHPAFLGKGPRR